VDYPKLPAVPNATTHVAALDFVSGLAQVSRATSTDDARPLLSGVLFTQEAGSLRVVATDGYRLAVRDLPGVNALADEDFIVPARAIIELQRSSATLDVEADIGVVHAGAEIHFIAGNQSISTRLIDGKYHNYKQLMPASYPNTLRIGKDTLLSSLGRIRVLARDSTSSVKLALKASGVDISTTSIEQGNVSDNVDGDYHGEEMTVAFNPQYLMEGIEAAPGDEVILETMDTKQPALVHGVEDLTFRYILMPVRV
jgi:DNA polymerase-3 subunit beta